MDTEKYLKLAVLAALLIIALVYPVVSALVLTGVTAWHLQNFKISDMALVQKVVRLTPPGIKVMVTSRTTSSAPVKLALPAPDPVRDVVPMADTKVRDPLRTLANWLLTPGLYPSMRASAAAVKYTLPKETKAATGAAEVEALMEINWKPRLERV